MKIVCCFFKNLGKKLWGEQLAKALRCHIPAVGGPHSAGPLEPLPREKGISERSMVFS